MKTVIMAGGKGTRIQSLFSEIPKPMVPIDGVPVLEREINSLREQGFDDIIITVSHLGQQITDYFGDGSGISPATGKPFGVKIEYFHEEVPLGNAAALIKLKDKLTEDFLLLNGDAIFDIDFKKFVDFHKSHPGWVSLFTHPNNHPYDSGLIIADKDKKVLEWLAKENPRPEFYHNRVNAGLHIINPKAVQAADIDSDTIGTPDENGKIRKVDLDRHILKPLAGTGKIFCYDSPEYVKDMGTPERFRAVAEDYINGIVSAKNLRNPQKAIFLDRDGTINRYVGFLRSPEEFELLPGVAEALRLINKSEYLAVVITNQPVIARGEVTYEQLDLIHKKMETLLGSEGAFIDALYFCPHHPHSGYEGEVKELKIDCDCRKPKPGLLLRAAKDFNIDLTESYMIGDSESDVLAGEAAGCRSILIERNQPEALLRAVKNILNKS